MDLGSTCVKSRRIHQPFALDTTRGEIADFSAQQFAGEGTLQLLMMNCQTLAEYQTTGVVFRDHESKLRTSKRTPAEFEVILRSHERPTDEVLRAAIAFEFELLLERGASESEYELLGGFFRKAAKVGGNIKALQTMLQAILMKPEAVYRMEIGLGPEDRYGRRRLSPTELALRSLAHLRIKGPVKLKWWPEMVKPRLIYCISPWAESLWKQQTYNVLFYRYSTTITCRRLTTGCLHRIMASAIRVPCDFFGISSGITMLLMSSRMQNELGLVIVI